MTQSGMSHIILQQSVAILLVGLPHSPLDRTSANTAKITVRKQKGFMRETRRSLGSVCET